MPESAVILEEDAVIVEMSFDPANLIFLKYINWLDENVGTWGQDWTICHDHEGKKSLVQIKDPKKAVLFMLKWR